ncbi:DoxX family protein [Marinomonas sp. GJ51-6]|uniref:DoxX family protein n=1 Tax=Marinomonas sp. GJ51-6 TaxID=2992802 RepID=UPI0029342739|nr:DoxX family protein [Marinomonas sp. GJ51-6]WOD06628.1 DoxX family protein [Marinomonas sp. GJ51-6]
MVSFIIFMVSLELTIFFLFSSCVKIVGLPQSRFHAHLSFFKTCGLNQGALLTVGMLELFGAATLWFPNYLGILGVLALCITSAGIAYARIQFDTWKNGLVAMTTFILSSWVLYEKCFGVLA